MAKVKRCPGCERNKTLDRFYGSKSAHGKLSLLCIGCLYRHGKLCHRCGEHRSIQEFPVDQGGFISDCRECQSNDLDLSLKRCSYCHEKKSRDQFGRNSRTEDGLLSFCKECRSIYRGYRRLCTGCGLKKHNRDFPRGSSVAGGLISFCLACARLDKSYSDSIRKTCIFCKEEKLLREYHKDAYTKDGFANCCKQCRARKYRMSRAQAR